MSTPVPHVCPACGSAATGNFCSSCGASLTPRACVVCRAELASQAQFCHRCGHPVRKDGRPAAVSHSDRRAWILAGSLCVLLVGGIVYRVASSATQPAVPDMANPGAATGESDLGRPGRAPDISGLSPRERFDRLFNRIMRAAERGDSGEVGRFTPMALAAYDQLDTRDVDARYHAAVLHLQAGDFVGARALADTILVESPGHLFGYIIRGTAAGLQRDPTALLRAQREFLAHYPAETAAKRLEYLEHKPVIEEFRQEAEKRER